MPGEERAEEEVGGLAEELERARAVIPLAQDYKTLHQQLEKTSIFTAEAESLMRRLPR